MTESFRWFTVTGHDWLLIRTIEYADGTMSVIQYALQGMP